jgi:MmyB-like transcription regulator ligand binding domain
VHGHPRDKPDGARPASDFDARPPRERNHARWIFLDPATRELYLDWPVVARENVANLRHDAAQHPDDPQLRELIGELSMASPEFRTWWAEHDVATRNSGTKRAIGTPSSAR